MSMQSVLLNVVTHRLSISRASKYLKDLHENTLNRNLKEGSQWVKKQARPKVKAKKLNTNQKLTMKLHDSFSETDYTRKKLNWSSKKH